ERHHRRPLADRALRRLLFETLPHPRRLRRLAPLLEAGRRLGAGRLPGRPGAMARVAPRVQPRRAMRTRFPELTPAVGERRGRVGLLLGCVQRVFYPEVHLATINALSAEGFEVLTPPAADCCGALELHGGREQAAVSKAAATIAAIPRDLDHVV